VSDHPVASRPSGTTRRAPLWLGLQLKQRN